MFIEQVWNNYDDDNSGHLDLEETQQFIMDNIGKLSNEFQFNKEDITLIFQKFDNDGSGTIDKQEMIEFINMLINN